LLSRIAVAAILENAGDGKKTRSRPLFETDVEAGGLITFLYRLARGENHEKDNLSWIGSRVLVLE